MVDSRFGAESVKDEPGTFCLTRKQRKLSKTTGSYQKDAGTYVTNLPMGQNWASIRILTAKD